jgi:hypothetical protein
VFFMSSTAPVPAFGGRIDIIRGEGSVLGPVVKDKPYGANSITESTQTLADGNRITQRNEARIHRDAAGRTRREQTLGGVGPWQAAGEPVTIISINDPVGDKSYVLDPAARTAREIRPFRLAIAQGVSVDGAKLDATLVLPPLPPVPPAGAGGGAVMTQRAGGPAVQVFNTRVPFPPIPAEAVGAYEPAEQLGEQVLEGLLVQGTRLTDTIPAGALGNERAIEIVTERWYSKAIDALVLQRFSDPRFGETTYRLVNVVQGEPSPDLFTVPQGYELKVDEGPQVGPGGFARPAPGVRVGPNAFVLTPEGAPTEQ